MLDDHKNKPLCDPSIALIRQIVTEYIIFPLGSELIRKQFPDDIRSFLFYGPSGTGKTMVVQAIATETRSIVFDLSPANIIDCYNDSKTSSEKMVAYTMYAAKEYQPSIIYIDECEKVFPKKQKKKKGQKKVKKNDMTNPARIKKALLKWKAKWMSEQMRITVIGCTNDPDNGTAKEFKKMFDKSIYFPFPDYTTRRLMWKTFIEKQGGELRTDFPLSTLAHISHGYSAGSIKKTCEKVITTFRKENLQTRPLVLQDFIGPLSLYQGTTDVEYEAHEKYTTYITSFKKPSLEANLEADNAGNDPKKKKKKKGK